MVVKDWRKTSQNEFQTTWDNGVTGDSLFLDQNNHFSVKPEWDVLVVMSGSNMTQRIGRRTKSKSRALKIAKAYRKTH